MIKYRVAVAMVATLLLAGAAGGDPIIDALIQRADHGDIQAQRELGLRYRDARGVARDMTQAAHWTKLAADAGDAEAIDDLGYMYMRGWGVPLDSQKAVACFQQVAQKTSAGAFDLGECLFGNQGIAQDLSKAVDCWKRAAELKTDGKAVLGAEHVAMAYYTGEGAPADRAQALAWCAKAIELGSAEGYILRGELEFTAGDVEAAKADWAKAAARNAADPATLHETAGGAEMLQLLPYRLQRVSPGKFAFVDYGHLHEGWNNCGSTTCAAVLRFQGAHVGQYDVKRMCPGSPVGTGTDWAELIHAAHTLGMNWKLTTFDPDDAGLAAGEKFVRSQLEADRPVIIDITIFDSRLPGGWGGHTLAIVGYIADGDQYILRDPAYKSPGLRVVTSAELGKMWRSRYYSAQATGKWTRPAIDVGDCRHASPN
jgi:tetratricopeptide (TPR) repeat protein